MRRKVRAPGGLAPRLLSLTAAVFLALLAGCGGDGEFGGDAVDEGENATLPTQVPTMPIPDSTSTSGQTETGTGDGLSGGDPVAGEKVFASAGCGGCHTLQAAGSDGTVGPDLDEEQPSFDDAVERVTDGKGQMPSFRDSLSDTQINDVAAYVAESTKG